MWIPTQPYNDLPEIPVRDLETPRVLKAVIAARAQLATLNEAAKRIPNPGVLISAVTLLEAQASSEVENIVTTTDDLFRSDSDVDSISSPETKETLRYRAALFTGVQSIRQRPLTFRTAEEVCTTIMEHPMTARNLPGTYIGDSHTGEALYTPPVGASILAEKISAWERFLPNGHGLDPLVVMAASHYQFEAIHPFTDGNGRTGRILNILTLMSHGLLEHPVLYLSRHLIRHKNKYYDHLLAVTDSGAWEEWILFMLDGVEQTSAATLEIIENIESVRDDLHEALRSLSPRGNSDLLHLLLEQPYTRISAVMERCSISRPTAAKWLRELVDAGLLQSRRVGRGQLFINQNFLDALTPRP